MENIDKVVDKVFARTKVLFIDVPFASILNFDVKSGTDYICRSITANCTINIINSEDGDSGVLELIMDSTGDYTITFGAMFTKRISEEFDNTASADNFVSWQKIGNDIIYSISTVQS